MAVDIASLRRLCESINNVTGGQLVELCIRAAEELPAVLDELEGLRLEHAACKVIQTLEDSPCKVCGYPDLRMIGAFGPICPNCGAGIDTPYRDISPNEPQVKVIGVLNCARCGGDHKALKYRKLRQPIEDGDTTLWEWWATCPTTGEPILMRIYPDAGIERPVFQD